MRILLTVLSILTGVCGAFAAFAWTQARNARGILLTGFLVGCTLLGLAAITYGQFWASQ